jgi:hypothetical protein
LKAENDFTRTFIEEETTHFYSETDDDPKDTFPIVIFKKDRDRFKFLKMEIIRVFSSNKISLFELPCFCRMVKEFNSTVHLRLDSMLLGDP